MDSRTFYGYHGYMNMARVAELKNNLSRYLAYVREGGEVLILDRDTPVARLVPFAAPATGTDAGRADWRQAEERLGQMERQGLISRGDVSAVRQWLGTGRPVSIPPGSRGLLDTLLEQRAEDSR